MSHRATTFLLLSTGLGAHSRRHARRRQGRVVPALSLASTLVLAVTAFAQDSPETRVDALFAAMDKTDLPGCSVSVMREGEIAYANGYGMANLEYGIAIEPSSVFHVASVSKQFTAFSIALLEAEGKLSLDDDVRDYVPELPDLGPTITIRHLIHHISGVRDQWDLLSMSGWRWEADVVTQKDVLEVLALQRGLNFEPGSEYLYSNSGYTLLAVIVERVSGQSLREFTTERIFAPLGMDRTHFHDDHETIVIDRAYAYAPDLSPGAASGGFTGRLKQSIPDFDVVGASSLFTTVEDLAKWDRNFYTGEIGGAALIERLHTRGVLNDGTEIPYAFALSHGTHNGLATVGHGGADAGYRSNFLRYPEQELSVAVLCNFPSSNPGALARQVGQVYLGDRMTVPEDGDDGPAAAEVEMAEAELQLYAGMYLNERTDRALIVRVRNGQLYQIANQRRRLVPLGGGRFAREDNGQLLSFTANGDDTGMVLRMPADADNPQILPRVPAADLDAAGLAVYTGRYHSDELGTDYEVAVDNNRLVFRHRKLDDQRVASTYVDGFVSGGRVIRFTRDANGTVDGFRLSSGRVWGVRFDKVGEAVPSRAPDTVFLADLTWTEARDAIAAGTTTIIFPTGGTEQNGPHMVLGKHHVIMEYTAEQIARRLGNTLVAPVLDYVPEGGVDPPSGHMRMAGTITLPNEYFMKVAEYAARSFKAHGFTDIVFLGDSGGNQSGLAEVAELLNAEWAGTAVRVHHAPDYYTSGFRPGGAWFEWLEEQGETAEDIGSHAGILGTAKLLALDPSLIRTDKLAGSDPENGVRGDPRRATAEYGRVGLEFKIEAAVAQIRDLMSSSR